MAITQAICTSFKKELLNGAHDFDLSSGDTFKLALYTSSASLDASTTAYSATNEATGTNYTAGGATLTKVDPATSGTTAYVDFADLVFSTVTITARGAIIYNTTPNTTSLSLTNPTVLILDFGADKSATAGDFTIQFPTASATAAILRLA
jgi:PKD repeat protein